MRPALNQGFRVASMVYRGSTGLTLTTPKFYTGNCYKDLEPVINHVKLKYPNSKIYAYGVSLGGIILSNYLAKSKT